MLRSVALSLALGTIALAAGCTSEDPPSHGMEPAGSGGAGSPAGGGTGGARSPGVGGGPASGDTGGAPLAEGGAGGGASAGGAPLAGAGIAARYPGDRGIDSDPAVVFADDFEEYREASELRNRWDTVYQNEYVKLTFEPANVYAGTQALVFEMPVQASEISNATDKSLSPELDVLYLRYYSKFESPYDILGSSHNGSSISAHYFSNGNATPGVRADGTNKFLVNLENWRGDAATLSPGYLNFYVYHPEQRDNYGDHWFPSGLVSPNTSLPYDFGPGFTPHEDIIPELDRWYCYEYMVKANAPGSRDGEVTLWLDGIQLVSFRNLRLRDVPGLKIDRFGLSFHIRDNAKGDKKYYDNVVAATAYIGPMRAP
jgi:hypothetical protein